MNGLGTLEECRLQGCQVINRLCLTIRDLGLTPPSEELCCNCWVYTENGGIVSSSPRLESSFPS